MSLGNFEKLWHIIGDLECCVHVQGCGHVYEESKKTLIFYFGLTLMPYTVKKRGLNQNFVSIESMPQYTSTKPLKKKTMKELFLEGI